MIDGSKPAANEVEVSVFGRGFGEAICLHVEGDWFLVDSCLGPDSGNPAALSYLADIGVDPVDAVRLVLITHWDDDHIHGVGRLVELCHNATVACSLALNRKDIVQFVLEQERVKGASGSGVDELRGVLQRCRTTGRLIWAKASLPLHPRVSGATPRVTALAPSDDAVGRSIESLIESAASAKIAYPRRYKAPEGPNGASVASMVRIGDKMVLLGADLENSANPLSGWEAVLQLARPDVRASLVKVPHHGSDGAHHDPTWDEIVDADAVAIVTPWSLGGNFLPLAEDLARLQGVAGRVFLTAMPELRRARKDVEVEKLLAKVGERGRVQAVTGWGQVRARLRSGDVRWHVDLDGDARLIE